MIYKVKVSKGIATACFLLEIICITVLLYLNLACNWFKCKMRFCFSRYLFHKIWFTRKIHYFKFMATPSKLFLITWVFVLHYYPSEFDGSIIIVPSSFLKRMLFSFPFSAHYALKLSCGSPLMNLSEAVATYSLWEHFQQTVLYNGLISVWRCRDKQMGLFTTTSCAHTLLSLCFWRTCPVYVPEAKLKVRD